MIICICRAIDEQTYKEMTAEEFLKDAQCHRCVEYLTDIGEIIIDD